MNIAIISYYFNDHHAEGIVTAKLARALSEAGHTISVFSNLVGNQEIVNENLTNLKYTSIDSESPHWWKYLENILPSNFLGEKILAIPSLLTYNSPDDYGWILNVKNAFIKAHLEKPFDIRTYFFWAILQPLYIPFIGALGLFNKFSWKK